MTHYLMEPSTWFSAAVAPNGPSNSGSCERGNAVGDTCPRLAFHAHDSVPVSARLPGSDATQASGRLADDSTSIGIGLHASGEPTFAGLTEGSGWCSMHRQKRSVSRPAHGPSVGPRSYVVRLASDPRAAASANWD